jgi:hemoglobin
MEQLFSTSLTRRRAVVGLALTAAPLASAGADHTYAQTEQTTPGNKPERSLYERLGGVFAIAAVVDHFSDAVVKNPIVGQKSKNPKLREWHTKSPSGKFGLRIRGLLKGVAA